MSSRSAVRTGTRSRARVDVVALVFGMVLTGIAAGGLWWSFVGRINWSVLATAAPLALVVTGLVGLLLSRRH